MEGDSDKVVYVGHLPYDMTEEQIKDVFKTVGPVKQIRLVFDRQTGKSKGFAFVQYYKPESAQSAVRNLDKYKVGNMQLKVNYSSGKFFDKNQRGTKQNGEGNQQANDEGSGIVPEIVDFVSSVGIPQKQQLISELKQLISENSEGTQAALEQNPQVTYAIVQTLFELKLIDGAAAQSLIVDPFGATEKLQSPPQQPQMAQPQAPTPMLQPPPNQSRPSSPRMQSPVPNQMNAGQLGRHKRKPASRQATNTPPPPQAPLNYPPPQAPPMVPPMMPPMSEEQKHFYRQIMSLTPEQISAMPVEQQQVAIQIKSQIMAGNIVL